jgi:hypothetical protein
VFVYSLFIFSKVYTILVVLRFNHATSFSYFEASIFLSLLLLPLSFFFSSLPLLFSSLFYVLSKGAAALYLVLPIFGGKLELISYFVGKHSNKRGEGGENVFVSFQCLQHAFRGFSAFDRSYCWLARWAGG